jgi:hypothetical protein
MTLVTRDDEQFLRKVYVRFNERAWGVGLGLICGGGLWLATVVLVLIGGPPVGPHLGLLAAYFPGYRVTLPGAFLGGAYGFVVGYVIGRTMSRIYNRLSHGR